MKILASVTAAACLSMISLAQGLKFEKQALELVQRTPVSTLEQNLPRSPFADWLKAIVGVKTGIVWQLSECEQLAGVREPGSDIPACVEANALLPDGRKVMVKIAVGTFRKGITGDPGFFYAIIEHRGQLISLNRLRDLPEGIRSPERLKAKDKVGFVSNGNLTKTAMAVNVKAAPERARTSEAPPPPPLPAKKDEGSPSAKKDEGSPSTKKDEGSPSAKKDELPPLEKKTEVRRVSEGALIGNAITQVGPLYPAGAKGVNAWGEVQVLVTISETGKVVEARAVSGHLLLRKAAITAARQWVFNPTKLNGEPVSIEGIITFDFPRP